MRVSMQSQTTLARSTEWVTGLQLDREVASSVRFHPAPPDSGVLFVRSDLPGEPSVKCCLDNARLQSRWSALVQDDVWIHHTEHILAAIAGHSLDNVIVELTSYRLPVVTGGSCAGFSQAITGAGIVGLSSAPRRVWRLRRPVWFEMDLHPNSGQPDPAAPAGRRYIAGIPDTAFSASYVFHVPHLVGLRVGLAEYRHAIDSFTGGIGAARTYYLQPEAEMLRDVLSSVQKDYIVLDANSPQRDVDEVARHKLTDFLGDLMILGRLLEGRFVVFRSGHRFHHALARRLWDDGYLEVSSQ